VCVHKNEPQGNRYAFNEKILKGENWLWKNFILLLMLLVELKERL
jgi:hypothetical protein